MGHNLRWVSIYDESQLVTARALKKSEVLETKLEDHFGVSYWKITLDLNVSHWTTLIVLYTRANSTTVGTDCSATNGAALGWPGGEIYWNRKPSTKLETNNFSLNLKVFKLKPKLKLWLSWVRKSLQWFHLQWFAMIGDHWSSRACLRSASVRLFWNNFELKILTQIVRFIWHSRNSRNCLQTHTFDLLEIKISQKSDSNDSRTLYRVYTVDPTMHCNAFSNVQFEREPLSGWFPDALIVSHRMYLIARYVFYCIYRSPILAVCFMWRKCFEIVA